jgi:hypothetical protein
MDIVKDNFCLELDTTVNSLIIHLVRSNVRDYGNMLIDGGQQWMLDRFSTRMVHTDLRAKYFSVVLILVLLKQQSEHRKVFIIQNYDVIKTSINLLKSETSPRIVRLLIELVSHSILRDSSDFNPLNPHDPKALESTNIEHSFLEQFFNYNGSDVYEELKHRMRANETIFKLISVF